MGSWICTLPSNVAYTCITRKSYKTYLLVQELELPHFIISVNAFLSTPYKKFANSNYPMVLAASRHPTLEIRGHVDLLLLDLTEIVSKLLSVKLLRPLEESRSTFPAISEFTIADTICTSLS